LKLTRLSDDTGVPLLHVQVVGNFLPQTPEHLGRAGKVETGEFGVVNALLDDLWGVSGHELDDGWGKTSLEQDLVDEEVGVGGHGRGLPDTDIADDDGSADKVTADSGEVEGGDGEDEAFEGAELRATAESAKVGNRAGVSAHFQVPAELRGGCWAYSSSTYLTLNRKKSTS
jgi:hypothetical protein